jgi:DNA-binding NarL/FixJ family response regulator
MTHATTTMENKIALILADDHPLVLEGLKLLFEHLPWIERVDLAHDGLELCEHPRIGQAHAVIADLAMPRLDGLSSIRRLRHRYPDLAIVAITGAGHWFPESEVGQAGADIYLSKQRPGEEVIAALEQALARHGRPPPAARHARTAMVPDNEETLSGREREILKLLGEGCGIEETSRILNISPATARKHREHLHAKLGTSNTATLTRIAVRMGLIAN